MLHESERGRPLSLLFLSDFLFLDVDLFIIRTRVPKISKETYTRFATFS